MKATIYDVSRLSGVSTATVSRAFSAPGQVKEDTRRRVYEAASALKYTPNAIARDMALQRSNRIAYLICKRQATILDEFYAGICEGIMRRANALNLQLIVSTADDWRQMAVNAQSKQVEGVIRTAASVLSDATKYTSVIVAPKLGTLRIKHVQLVPVAERTALMVIVTNVGIVKDALIRVPEGMDADDLYAISRMLTEKLADKPLEAVRQAFSELLRNAETNRKLLGETLQVIEKRLEAGGDASDVIVGGPANMLEYPEYSDVNKARSFLAVLESKDTLRKLISRDGGMEISIRIGPENQVPALNDCSIVTASYRVGDHSNGTLGIIGPTRMNYNRVISVLEFMGRALSDVLSEYR